MYMKNQINDERVINKWQVRLKKLTKWIIILSLIYGLCWLFFPLLNVRLMMLMTSPRAEHGNKLSDYYYTNIGGITYAKDKFYISLRKPYLFNVSYGYVYSSNNLITWQDEISSVHIPTAVYSFSDMGKYYVESDGFSIWKSDNSNISNDSLPREVNGNCYIVVFQSGFISPNCNGTWKPYNFIVNIEEKLLLNNIDGTTVGDPLLTDGKICALYKQGILKEKLLESIYCAPKLLFVNISAYHVLHKIIQTNNLDILLDGSHTTYGNGKYVGIFYKNRQYYFIISTDGVHYEIKPVPSELASSLAINLFN